MPGSSNELTVAGIEVLTFAQEKGVPSRLFNSLPILTGFVTRADWQISSQLAQQDEGPSKRASRFLLWQLWEGPVQVHRRPSSKT